MHLLNTRLQRRVKCLQCLFKETSLVHRVIIFQLGRYVACHAIYLFEEYGGSGVSHLTRRTFLVSHSSTAKEIEVASRMRFLQLSRTTSAATLIIFRFRPLGP